MNIKEETRKMKLASPILAAASLEKRNHALALIRESLLASKEEIFAANHKDLALAEESGIAPAVKKRLKFDEGKLADVEAELTGLIALPDPIDRVTLARELDEGLSLYRVTCPIGVIGVIFEARPDALVQISSLCLKSGNCAILKGGKETTYTNRVLFRLIQKAAIAACSRPSSTMRSTSFSNVTNPSISSSRAARMHSCSTSCLTPRSLSSAMQTACAISTSTRTMRKKSPSPPSWMPRCSIPPPATQSRPSLSIGA